METMIEVCGLTKKFSSFTAVDNISFSVGKGEILGFLGPNGAGKSTTIRMLVTLLQPTSGSATVGGYDIIKQQNAVRSRVGLVAEKIILYPQLTAMENLLFFGGLNHLPASVIRERAERWLNRLGMQEWVNSRTGTYSTGMKQRINIVRALLTEPDVLFLDEPTLGLDPQTTYLIRQFIEERNKQGTTIILTTHDMYEAEVLSNRVAIIDHGKIMALDTVAALKKTIAHPVVPTLEDVFLHITGTDIRDTAGKMAPSTAGPRRFGRPQNRIR